MSESTPTTAGVHGPAWGARAAIAARLYSGISWPVWRAVAADTGIGVGTRVLDVGCGAGEFCRLAADRGAVVSGIDAAEGAVEVARQLVPDADIRVGAMESLPWDAGTFDVVTGFHAFHFAADLVAALAEAKRVARPGGLVAICNWGRRADRELLAIGDRLRELEPPGPRASPSALGEPGALEDLARRAGLVVRSAREVDMPYPPADRETLVEGMMAAGSTAAAVEHSGEDAVRAAITEAAEPYRLADGSYRFENKSRVVITVA
ncbi:class I SAM-dependent methyltransferase [Actinokineospora sp.]|uniref:class I SAM-dependent methyltransferase n=1 Tax=Actinokineospora sp. TaxID=1872133 RepID=UPI004037DB37